MICNGDVLASTVLSQEVSDVWLPQTTYPGTHAQHLIEIAVVQIALPIHADEAATHHGIQVLGVVRAPKQLHVLGKAAFAHQGAAKALNWHIGQCKQMVETDAEVHQQLTLVVLLQSSLRWRQRWPLGVVDQIKHQTGTLLPVTQGIELVQARNAAVKHSIATLAINISE